MPTKCWTSRLKLHRWLRRLQRIELCSDCFVVKCLCSVCFITLEMPRFLNSPNSLVFGFRPSEIQSEFRRNIEGWKSRTFMSQPFQLLFFVYILNAVFLIFPNCLLSLLSPKSSLSFNRPFHLLVFFFAFPDFPDFPQLVSYPLLTSVLLWGLTISWDKYMPLLFEPLVIFS